MAPIKTMVKTYFISDLQNKYELRFVLLYEKVVKPLPRTSARFKYGPTLQIDILSTMLRVILLSRLS
jgi:hypothetical protein